LGSNKKVSPEFLDDVSLRRAFHRRIFLSDTLMAIGGAMTGEYRGPRMSHMQSANKGPADTMKRVGGVVAGGKREDDGRALVHQQREHPAVRPGTQQDGWRDSRRQ